MSIAEILDIMKRDPNSPDLLTHYYIHTHMCTHKREELRDIVENMDQITDISKLWKLLKQLIVEKNVGQGTKQLPSMEARSLSKQLATR